MNPSSNPDINSTKATERIEATALQLLEENPEGLRWADLNRLIEASDASLHPKTVNGTVWRLVARYPDRVHKPSRGVFRLKKYG